MKDNIPQPFRRKGKKVYYFYFYRDGRRLCKSTGKSLKYEAQQFIDKFIGEGRLSKITLREYCQDFFLWDTCPHIRRLRDERKTVTQNYAATQRYVLEKHVLSDPIVDSLLRDIKRADIISFRTRIIEKGLARISHRWG